MKNFNTQLKEFCQLTIELIDIREENKKYAEETLFLDKIASLVRKISTEIEVVDINSKNIDDVQKIYAFLNQFGASNLIFKIVTDNKISKLNKEIEKERTNQNFEKISTFKNEIKSIEKHRMEIKNWYFI